MSRETVKTKSPALLFAIALGVSATALLMPTSTSAMSACNPNGCSYYYAGGGYSPSSCKPYSDHCHCFHPADDEQSQHQDGCTVPILE